MKKTYELAAILVMFLAIEVGIWSWGYWVGQNDLKALQATKVEK